MDGGGGGAAGHDAARGVLQATTLGAYLSSKPPSAVLTLSTGQSAGQALRALAAANVLSAPLFDVGRCARARAPRAALAPSLHQRGGGRRSSSTAASAPLPLSTGQPGPARPPVAGNTCSAACSTVRLTRQQQRAHPPAPLTHPCCLSPVTPLSGDFIGFLGLDDILHAFLALINIRELTDENRAFKLRTAGELAGVL